ncbi:ankyrin repeat domain-containing protein 39 [Manduca sexta]|uniref:Ankyrin repeat domain-containing protein 39 n=1 Tax=Manduca sexta TaxID=7130 RepID=A0A921ZBX9_MANSE|nr:ankyrin repeat domain-containing protein 39 [Manduca sexta]KAG6454089.1 hypothetical protein O3G_MSEX008465 [Manduca sexta]
MDHNNCDHSNCTNATATSSVCQTLSEMDWERGMWYAAFNGDKDRVHLLIDKSMKVKEAVNAPDNSGYTALHYAARNGHVDICKTLLSNGALIDSQTRTGKATPLHKAAAAGKVEAVKFLIQSGANIRLQDIDGETALHKAVANKNFNLVDILLQACPELKMIKDNKGRSGIGN